MSPHEPGNSRTPDDPLDSSLDSSPEDLDEALAFAYGEDSVEPDSPSVLGRIGEVSGSKPGVTLRDEVSSGQTPLLKPLAPGESREAGKYVVQGELGRGGVGAVHKGHDQDLGRDVALKFLHDKYKDHADVLHRFVEEAQIGGQLQHPGIVPVYDLGMASGKPFFAMKLVKGQTLAKKLADRESPSDDRRTFLAIFEDVCQTLAYAHARGVVHRDLKPANIMIGSFGEVQVVDWGMGKVLQQGGIADEEHAAKQQASLSVIETVRSSGHGSQSIVGSVMGTPAYMPPEQARGDVEAMDERSDVFALGAILCEILTGQPPYVGEPEELISMAAMAELDDANARLEACDAEPEMVELATRCLMPAPAARPRSGEVVAKSVHDHLAAVEARVHEARVEAAEAKVRAAALRKTQKLGVALTTVIAAGLVVSLWYWRAAKTAAENERTAHAAAEASATEARESEQVAQRELARALEIKELITGMLESVTPEVAQGADTKLLEGILATASKKLAEGAIQDELVAAELHGVTGKVYHALGRYAEAERHLPVAFELRQRVLGKEHPSTLYSMLELARLFTSNDRFAEAERLLLEMLEAQRRVLGEEHPNTSIAAANLGSLYLSQGRYAEAEQQYLETLELQHRVLGKEHPEALLAAGYLGIVYKNQSRYAEAEQLLLETLQLQRRVLGDEHPGTLGSMSNLATVYLETGRFAEAEPPLLEALEIQRRVLGEEHPDTLGSMSNLADIYLHQGHHAKAEPLYLKVLEIQRRVLGEEHSATLQVAGNLGNLYRAQGRYAEAEAFTHDILENQRRVLGDEHPAALATAGNLVNLYLEQGQYAKAEPLYVEVLAAKRRVLGEENRDTLNTAVNLAALYQNQGRYTEAEPLLVEACELQRRTLGAEHPSRLITMRNLAILYSFLARDAEAEALLFETLETQRRVLGDEHPDTLETAADLGNLYATLERDAEAEALLFETLEAQGRVLGKEHPKRLPVMSNLAYLYATQDPPRYREAEQLLLEAVELERRVLGEEHPVTLVTISRLGDLYNLTQRFEEAAELLEASVPITRRVLGSQHIATNYALRQLVEAYLGLGRTEGALALQRELLELEAAPANRDDADAATLNSIAWTLLTTEPESLQDPDRALGYARRACALEEGSGGRELWAYLDSLAFALYRTGDIGAAVEAQRRALALMPTGADSTVIERLAEYEAALKDD